MLLIHSIICKMIQYNSKYKTTILMYKTLYFITINKIYKKLRTSWERFHPIQVCCKLLLWVTKHEIVCVICKVFYFFAITENKNEFENKTEIWCKNLMQKSAHNLYTPDGISMHLIWQILKKMSERNLKAVPTDYHKYVGRASYLRVLSLFSLSSSFKLLCILRYIWNSKD